MAEKSRSRYTESFTDKGELQEQQTMSRDGSFGDGESFETEEKTGPTPRTMSRFTATLRSCGRKAWDPSGFGSVRKAPVSTNYCLLYTSPSPRDLSTSRMPSSA